VTDSSTAGYLAPLTLAPAEDVDLDQVLCRVVAGIAGLTDALVVVKGLPRPALQPDRPTTWCAVGVTGIDAPPNIDAVHDGEADRGLGQSRHFRQEEIEVTASFYGPAARSTAALLRDNFEVGQNRDALSAQGLVYVRPERITGLADFENTQFVRRADFVFRLRRMVGRTYAIRNVVELAAVVGADGGSPSNPWPVVADVGDALGVDVGATMSE
jgi:hypothetical protein